ncbi:MAG TPA: Coenzyme F420 hydrogenase/dehydrogenase, beta subunit C-terminal domain [Caulobacteraceae bacterium]|nr:Coenzyme F420 hydrogenase/dehydrogenase, beta subunit C-terminal domain [Caulobacteraceae bacterium]
MTAGSPTVARVLRGELCAGCGLCAAVAPGAIEMGTAAPGYSRPRQIGPVGADAERVIAAACPGAVVEPWPPAPGAGDAPHVHPVWGPWRSISTGYATDEQVRWRASSGGALTALLIHALRSGVVDRVVHVSADPRHPTRNVMTVSATETDLIDGAGSRYSASSPLAVIEEVLAGAGAAAFVGKPCDVSALRRLARVDPRVGRRFPLALSFFCAGVSSHDAAGRLLGAMGVAPEAVTAFRYRGEGWPGNAAARLADGSVRELRYAESWGEHLSGEVQFRCKICPDAVGGVADIACADAWYGDADGYPNFEEQDGRSLIMARTPAGERLLASALAAGALAAEPLEVDKIDLMQPGQARRKRLVRARLAALALTLQPRPDMRGTRIEAASLRAGLGEQARNLVGTVRRVVNGRRSRR